MAEKDDIVAHHTAGTLPELFIERARRHRTDDIGKAFYATLTTLHNDGTIDVLDAARAIDDSTIDKHDFFTVMHVYCNIIPDLEAEVPAMLAAVKALVAYAGNDLVAGMPNDAYRAWAERGDRAQATIDAIDPADPQDSAYVFLSLQLLSKNTLESALTQAIAYLTGSAAPARSAAAKAIGSMALSTPEDRIRAADELMAASSSADDNSLGHILAAVCEIARAHPEMERAAVNLIDATSSQVGDQSIHQVSLELMFHGETLSPAIIASLTTIAHKVAIGNLGTIESIDAAAGQLVRRGRVDEALALITPLITVHDELSSLERFDSFVHSVFALTPIEQAKLMIGWLLSLDRNLGTATASLVGCHHGDEPLLVEGDAKALGLSEADIILLAHRAIGYMFMHPITVASLLLSLIRTGTVSRLEAIADILFDPLLINYSGQLADWLNTQTENSSDVAQPVINDLLSRLKVYVEGLRKAGRIKELLPSERERLIENRLQHESMRQAHKLAEKRSVFMSIVSRSVLLYGNRSVSYFEGPNGERQRNEMKLHAISHIFEAPRLHILEPFDLDYRLRVFRAMREMK